MSDNVPKKHTTRNIYKDNVTDCYVQGVRYQNLSNTTNDMNNSFFSIYQKNDKKDDNYDSDAIYPWPGEGTLNFVALGNAPASGLTANMNGTAVESFTYTVPASATAQNDIVVATLNDVLGSANSTQALDFKHIMSAVQFKVGTKMARGKIKSITINNIKTTGSYNVTTGTWTPNTDSKGSYTAAFSSTDANGNYEPNDKNNGDIINDGACTFMMMPQVLDADAEVVVEFIYDNAPNTVKELRANIAIDPNNTSQRREWEMGKTTYYSLSVDENYNLTITPKGDVLDAHYVMTDVTVNIDTETDQAWTLTVEATNIDNKESKDVSIEYKDKLNTLIKVDGYWINNIVEGSTTKSARGTKTVNGTKKGEHTITVFIPENITADERKITLTLSLDSGPKAKKTEYLYQMCPYWDREKGFGWEKVENSETGQYGFTWNRVACYMFTYSLGSTNLITEYSKQEAIDIVKTLMQSYGLPTTDSDGKDTTAPDYGGFITIDTFTHKVCNSKRQYGLFGPYTHYEWEDAGGLDTRIAVIVDYRKIDFVNMMSAEDGIANTKGFFTASALLQFEDALKSMKKQKEEGVAFRQLDATTDKNSDFDGLQTEANSGAFFFDNYGGLDGTKAMFIDNGGQTDDASGILQYVIRRNAFNLVTKELDEFNKYTSLDMNANNIEWYLPAVRQFDDAILNWATGNTTFTASNFWSSTAAANNQAYAGGTTAPESRENLHQVVVQRIVTPIPQPTTISEIDTEEMKGGENGEAQWVE